MLLSHACEDIFFVIACGDEHFCYCCYMCRCAHLAAHRDKVGRWMDGWMDARMERWMDGSMVEYVDVWMDGWMSECMQRVWTRLWVKIRVEVEERLLRFIECRWCICDMSVMHSLRSKNVMKTTRI